MAKKKPRKLPSGDTDHAALRVRAGKVVRSAQKSLSRMLAMDAQIKRMAEREIRQLEELLAEFKRAERKRNR